MRKTETLQLEDSRELVKLASGYAQNYLQELASRGVAPTSAALSDLEIFNEAMPDGASPAGETIELLHRVGSPATVATAGGRFYGLVVGGSLPATVGARVLNAAWDQLATMDVTSPVGVYLERIAARWVLETLQLPVESSVGFVSGTTMGNFVSLAAARHELLQRQGWNVESRGLNGAPPIHIVASEEIHITVKKVLAMLGLGYEQVDYVPCDANGAIDLKQMPPLSDRSLILTQAGNVNSGVCDPIGEISELAHEHKAWVHVDGAFGLWAAASESKRLLLPGLEKADSWVTDGHKWLNTPYDCGIAICKHPMAVHSAMSTVAPYLSVGAEAAPKDMVPELSRSARGVEVWAALRSLGKAGVQDLIDRCCDYADTMAQELAGLGFTVLNDVVLNQVVFTHDQHESKISDLTEHVVDSGEAWFGPTHWRGRDAARISFSSWVTTQDDVERTVAAIKRSATELGFFDD